MVIEIFKSESQTTKNPQSPSTGGLKKLKSKIFLGDQEKKKRNRHLKIFKLLEKNCIKYAIEKKNPCVGKKLHCLCLNLRL